MEWLRQTDEPLFPDVLWSRPENRRHAGKLLIIGGHGQSFSAVSAAYSAAAAAGVGTARVIVPDSLRKTLSLVFPEAEYAPSTPIGSFSRKALAELLDATDWADGVLLAGGFGRNSETAILLESFIQKYDGLLVLAGDSLDYFINDSSILVNRPRTVLVASIRQLQKLASPILIEQSADLIRSVGQISEWAASTKISAVTVQSGQIIVADGQRVSTTPVKISAPHEGLAACAGVWRLQQPEKAFESLTTAAYCSVHE
jgi:NAD(P)H-hydrate repair Nnr-like enzyme with NAD(P)H-hydrate dehydratase domain